MNARMFNIIITLEQLKAARLPWHVERNSKGDVSGLTVDGFAGYYDGTEHTVRMLREWGIHDVIRVS